MLTERSPEVKKHAIIMANLRETQQMKYQLIIDNSSILTGSVLEAGIILGALILAGIIFIIYIWKRLRENARLKYEFITIVAHKFRTPLTYVKWVCDSLVSEETDQYKKKSFEDIKKSNQKIIDLTSTLIEIADTENLGKATYVYEKMPICESVKNITNNFKDSFHEKNLFLSFKCKDDKAKVRVDKSRLEFAINTLLENARNYTPPGKNVEIAVSNTLFKVMISVEDDGIGISKQDLPHVFSKFFRGKNARVTDTEGFGVGLYLTSSIIKHLHGKIKVESPGEDQGSRFTIVLPRTR